MGVVAKIARNKVEQARLLAERLTPGGRLIGLDRDAAMLDLARLRLVDLTVTLVQAPLSRLREALDRGSSPEAEAVLVGGVPYRVRELQDALVTATPGDSVAYLTDFLLDEAAAERLAGALRGVGTVVCESQYRHADHRFEWTRQEFQGWATGIAARFGYAVRFLPVGPEHAEYGSPTQMGVFTQS